MSSMFGCRSWRGGSSRSRRWVGVSCRRWRSAFVRPWLSARHSCSQYPGGTWAGALWCWSWSFHWPFPTEESRSPDKRTKRHFPRKGETNVSSWQCCTHLCRGRFQDRWCRKWVLTRLKPVRMICTRWHFWNVALLCCPVSCTDSFLEPVRWEQMVWYTLRFLVVFVLLCPPSSSWW